ncbi:flagellar hook-associated protein FlgK [Fictibacillus phosphorivorans]|uniref:flagellar hook-associated protein FlgK n=1 Tax=Fictibacillus phosphorivorans TaxID=1221500 RepID=UPI00203C1FC4|nr:flagellar hook-associated protein FlgK [Fictibacillus phosphorivorans]MCM3718467.1 flagellar hook-associated protein FlgK [Fictibacillus phosphorivorans]MCM3776177.1 flagellar hook-associated protein FlgK [Fictibacillus phosphorivorans]
MSSTFHGLETARRGMFTQQTALQTTGNNIANANTPGYSRQRVNFVHTEAYPAASMNRPQIPGQMGTGVAAGSIQRVREGFLDTQFRGENNKLGYWSARSEALEKMEDIMNEPSDNGLAKTLDRFWQSLQDLSVNPEDSGARSVVRQRGLAVAETFNYLSNSLTSIQEDLKTHANLTTKEINALLDDIQSINKQISEVEPHGYLPNTLYDERDNLVDRLSTLLEVEVSSKPSSGKPDPLAAGLYDIKMKDKDGNEFVLVDSSNGKVNRISINDDAGGNGLANSISIDDNAPVDIAKFAGGKLKGLIESYGYNDNGVVKGIYPEMLANLDQMAFQFATEFNEVHASGWSLSEIEAGTQTGYAFFDFKQTIDPTNPKGAAKQLKLHDDMNELDHIAAATNPFGGDGSNALKLADVKNSPLNFPGSTSSLQSFYEGAIGKMAVDAQQAVRLTYNSAVLTDSVQQRRLSVSGVSLDEEMTNMIQFQHAYNASARNITVIDEMLDKIINGMGVGGR